MSSRSAMARKARTLNLKRSTEGKNAPIEINYRRFVLSVLCMGINPLQGITLMLLNNIKAPSPSTFYRIQKELKYSIFELTIENMLQWQQKLPKGATISFDGAWSHRRNAKQCVVTFYNKEINKIVDFQIVEKDAAGVKGNYNGPSNLMESFGLTLLMERWKNKNIIAKYCHDNDGRAKKIIEKFIDLDETFDPGHSLKSMQNKFQKINIKYHMALSPFHSSLFNFMKTLQNSEYTIEERELYWMNTINHYQGDHSHCCDPNHTSKVKEKLTSEAKSALLEFLVQTMKFVKIDASVSTQSNESYNALHAKLCNKTTNWGVGYDVRTWISILQFNNPDTWMDLLFDKLGIEQLSVECEDRLNDIFSKKMKERISKASPDSRKKERERRLSYKSRKEEMSEEMKMAYKARKANVKEKESTFKYPTLPLTIAELDEFNREYHSIPDSADIHKHSYYANVHDIIVTRVSKWPPIKSKTFKFPPLLERLKSFDIIYDISSYVKKVQLSILKGGNADVIKKSSHLIMESKELLNHFFLINAEVQSYEDVMIIESLKDIQAKIHDLLKDIPIDTEQASAADFFLYGNYRYWIIQYIATDIRRRIRFMMRTLAKFRPGSLIFYEKTVDAFMQYVGIVHSIYSRSNDSLCESLNCYFCEANDMTDSFINASKEEDEKQSQNFEDKRIEAMISSFIKTPADPYNNYEKIMEQRPKTKEDVEKMLAYRKHHSTTLAILQENTKSIVKENACETNRNFPIKEESDRSEEEELLNEEFVIKPDLRFINMKTDTLESKIKKKREIPDKTESSDCDTEQDDFSL